MSAANGWELTTALAPDFTWLSTGTDFFASFSAGPTVTANLTDGVYRMQLAPAATDFVRASVAAINAAMAVAGRLETFALGPNEDGRMVLSLSAGTFTATVGPMLATLGWLNQPVAVATSTASYQPRYIVYSVCAYDGVWAARQDGATEVTAGGTVYSFGGSDTSYLRELQVEKIPWDPNRALTCESPATPWWPDMGYYHLLGNTAVVRPWSVLDVLRWCTNSNTAMTIGDFQDLRSSTSTRYWIGRITTVLSPVVEREDAKWPAFVRHKLGFMVGSGVNTGTRA